MAICSAIALYRSSWVLISPRPSSTLPRTVFSSFSGGSCWRIPTVAPGCRYASPLLACSNPAMIFRTVDFPAPFGPTTPIFAPGRKFNVTSSRMTLSPWAFRTFCMV